MSLRIEFPHTLPIDDARARLQALGEYLTNRHGIGVRWEGDRGIVRGKVMVVDIDGAFQISPDKVVLEAKDPGFLWRGKAKEYLNDKLRTYLDPRTAVDALPRR